MVQILNRPKQPGLGSLLGQGIATGLSDRFRMLDEQKKLKQARGDTQAALEALGYEPSIAQRLSALDTQTLRQVLSQQHEIQQSQMKTQSQQQQAQQQAQQSDTDLQEAMKAAGIPDDLAQEVLPLLKQYPANQRAEFIQELSSKVESGEEVPEEQKKQYQEMIDLLEEESPEQLSQLDFSPIAQAAQGGPLTLDKFNEMFIGTLRGKNAPSVQPAEQTPPIPQVAQEPQPQAPERSMLEEVGGRREEKKSRPTVAEVLKRPSAKESAEDKKYRLKEEDQAAKEGQKVIEEIEKENKGAEEIDRTLKRMTKIIEEGGLPTAALYTGLNELKNTITPTKGAALGATLGSLAGGGAATLATGGIAALPAALAAGKTGALVGGTLGALVNPIVSLIQYGQKGVNPNQQEFEKLSQGFLKYAKNYFPRLTERELIEYMKTVPTLSQTDAGKKAIIKNMGLMNRIAKIKNNVLQDILEENDGKIPKNLRALVDKRAAPRIKGIEKLLEEGLDDAVNLF